MEDITSKYDKEINEVDVELFWDPQRQLVIMFKNGIPYSFESLNDNENTVESAVPVGRKLLNGYGKKL